MYLDCCLEVTMTCRFVVLVLESKTHKHKITDSVQPKQQHEQPYDERHSERERERDPLCGTNQWKRTVLLHTLKELDHNL
jgi:hypothetical protein